MYPDGNLTHKESVFVDLDQSVDKRLFAVPKKTRCWKEV